MIKEEERTEEKKGRKKRMGNRINLSRIFLLFPKNTMEC